ncbi:hypothetical protein [Larkinella soli]|uniref:hypothetical protein n=1 Tax=Larkinella soli TaxID=1770527 RepID=UPI000FFB1C8C|nr:hypothetical protein [Larkinella soli]
MKRFSAIATLFLFICLTGCKKDEDSIKRSDLLVANKWSVRQITDTQGRLIAKEKMGIQTLVLYELIFDFKANKQVVASDRITKQVKNGGTWELVDNETAIDVDIPGLKARFGLVEISRSKMVLRNKIPVSGTETDANLEFEPVL